MQKYCSLTCCKAHKEVCSSTQISSSSVISDTATLTAVSEPEAGIEISTTEPTTKELIGVDLLSEEKKNRLKNSPWLQDILKSNRLRSQIVEIDKSLDPLKALRNLRKMNPEFSEFVYRMLDVLECEDDDNTNGVTTRGVRDDTRKRKLVS